jgi:hypothetical protein
VLRQVSLTFNHQPHQRRVLKAQVSRSHGFKAAVLINHSLDVLHGCSGLMVVEVGFEVGQCRSDAAAAAHGDL